MTDVIYCILIAFCLLCFRLEKFYICCYLIADVIHCTLCSGFFAMSISLRLCRYLDYQFVLFLIIGVLSFLFCFSFPGMRSSFIRLFPHGRCYSLHFYYFYMQEIFSDTIDLVAVLHAILTSRQTCEKLQCLYENLMSNNFRKTAVLKKTSIVN